MKYFYLPVLAFASSLVFLSFQRNETVATVQSCARKNANGAPAGRTGAPGEPSCATSLCHSGTAQDGSTENVLTLLDGVTPVTDYIPNQAYTVVVTMASNPNKRGFQATALTDANVMAGNFTGITAGGTAISTSAGRKYANHTSTSNLSSQMTQWSFTWTAPATNVGTVTFYLATNKTNESNTSAGDVIYLSQHQFGSTASVSELDAIDFEVGYNVAEHQLEISLESAGTEAMILNLLDLNGKSVFHSEIGKANEGTNTTSVKLPTDLKNGVYVLNLFLGNKPFSKKVMVQR